MRIAGFRAFQIRVPFGLYPLAFYQRGPWERGENHFVPCARGVGITHPSVQCVCGFHAFFRLSTPEMVKFMQRQTNKPYYDAPLTVVAAVTGWGRTTLHRTGFRASKAEIIAVKTTGEPWLDNCIRSKYDCPIVQTNQELELKAAPWGCDEEGFDDSPTLEMPPPPSIIGWVHP